MKIRLSKPQPDPNDPPSLRDTQSIPSADVKLDCSTMQDMFRPYLEKALHPNIAASMENHLHSCQTCTDALDEQRHLMVVLDQTFPNQGISTNFTDRTYGRYVEGQYAEGEVGRTTTSSLDPVLDEETQEKKEEAGFFATIAAQFHSVPWWFASGVFHGLLLLLILLIGSMIYETKNEDKIITTQLAEQNKEEEPEEEVKRDLQPKEVVVEEMQTVEDPVVVHEDVVVEDHNETDNSMNDNMAMGDEDAISDIPLGGTGSVAAIGLGGGGGGAFGHRGKGGRRRAVRRGGGSEATESAVDAALAWLARHQEDDGRWDCMKYCKGNKHRPSGKHSIYYDPGVSGLAILAFLGAGHTTKMGKYKTNVRKALDYLVSVQEADGCFGPKKPQGVWGYMYNHGIAALAMAEGAGMCREEKYKQSAQKGIDYILASRGPHGVWGYGAGVPRFDTSVTGWMAMALKSGKIAGLKVPAEAFQKIRSWMNIDSIEDEYKDPTMIYANANPVKGRKGPAMTGISMLLATYTGSEPTSPSMQIGAQKLVKNLPDWQKNTEGRKWAPQNADDSHIAFNNEYTWYYATLVLFQVGGAEWKQWNEALKKALVPNQRKGGPMDGSTQDTDGSWDPVNGWSAKLGGRVYETAICALCLEVYYRYLPIYR